MKKILILTCLLFATIAYGQTDIAGKYRQADSLLALSRYEDAYTIFREIEPVCDQNDTLYSYILWYSVNAVSALEKEYRMQEKFDKSLAYSLEALALIKKGKEYFNEKFTVREYWMHKNLIVSYFGLGQLDNARKHQDILYQAYKDRKLPEGLDQYYNFTFFRWENKNVWGYEWYPELGDPEAQGSFSKIVYYVYSTNPDGSDKDQLYRLHVLKFHKIDNSVKFDYVLTKRLETATNEKSGTLYAYTYDKKIDYIQLQEDIREVLKGNYEPDMKNRKKK